MTDLADYEFLTPLNQVISTIIDMDERQREKCKIELEKIKGMIERMEN